MRPGVWSVLLVTTRSPGISIAPGTWFAIMKLLLNERMNTHFVALTGTYVYQNDNGKQMPVEQVMTQEPESLKNLGKFPRRGVSSFFCLKVAKDPC